MKRGLGVSVLLGAVAVAAVALAQTRGVTNSEIVLGMHTDLSGPAATYGVSSSNAVKMRFDDVNGAGSIHGLRMNVDAHQTRLVRHPAECPRSGDSRRQENGLAARWLKHAVRGRAHRPPREKARNLWRRKKRAAGFSRLEFRQFKTCHDVSCPEQSLVVQP